MSVQPACKTRIELIVVRQQGREIQDRAKFQAVPNVGWQISVELRSRLEPAVEHPLPAGAHSRDHPFKPWLLKLQSDNRGPIAQPHRRPTLRIESGKLSHPHRLRTAETDHHHAWWCIETTTTVLDREDRHGDRERIIVPG